MHPIDLGASVVFRFLPGPQRVFAGGWGDPAMLDLLDVASVRPPEPADLVWERSWLDRGRRIMHGTFRSPLAGLPAAAAQAVVMGIEPPDGTQRHCVLLPAWNDEGFATRRRFADRLADHGIGSILLEAPLYGSRRIRTRGAPLGTVADFAAMTRGIVEEGRALLARLAGESTVGVAGFSMGGSLAATVGATVPFPVAIAPLAAAHAPNAVFVDGVLRSAVAWPALGRGGRTKLAEVLGRPSVLRIPPTPWTAQAVLVGGIWDGFVPLGAIRVIHDHWPGSELQSVAAGHATLLWRKLERLVAAIVRAFDRFQAAHSKPSS